MIYEIWLGDHYSHFDHGIVHTADGRQMPMKVWINGSTYGKESVQVTDEVRYTYPEFLVSWLTSPGTMEFYSWDRSVERITLHNASQAPILVDGFRTLEPGETLEIDRDE